MKITFGLPHKRGVIVGVFKKVIQVVFTVQRKFRKNISWFRHNSDIHGIAVLRNRFIRYDIAVRIVLLRYEPKIIIQIFVESRSIIRKIFEFPIGNDRTPVCKNSYGAFIGNAYVVFHSHVFSVDEIIQFAAAFRYGKIYFVFSEFFAVYFLALIIFRVSI